MPIFLNDKSIRKNEKSIKNIRKPNKDFRILHIEQKSRTVYVYIEQKIYSAAQDDTVTTTNEGFCQHFNFKLIGNDMFLYTASVTVI